MALPPQLIGNLKRINLEGVPPSSFISSVMNFSVVQSTKRDRKFVTDFHAHSAGLGKREVVRVGRQSCAF
jgi:hypothetical protein